MLCTSFLLDKTRVARYVPVLRHQHSHRLTWLQTMSVGRKKEIYDICVKYGQFNLKGSRLADGSGASRRDNC